MRAFSAILGLVLCLIAARAEELPVIKDSEAIQYVGKNVEVRGFVVSVTTSPLGTTLINFDETTRIRRCLDSLRPVQKLRLTGGSLRSKGKRSGLPAQSNFTNASKAYYRTTIPAD